MVQGPSDPIKLAHVYVYVYEYVLQDYKVFTHPLPIVKHPDRNFEQSALVKSVLGASVHARGLHTVEPESEFTVHGPSEPTIPAHPTA